MIAQDYENQFPKFSEFNFNGLIKRKYRMEPPPNHEKKRKDEIVNLSGFIKKNKNRIELSKQVEQSDQVSYICALFVVKTFDGDEVISFENEHTKNSLKSSFDFIKQRLSPEGNNNDPEDDNDLIFERKVNFTTT